MDRWKELSNVLLIFFSDGCYHVYLDVGSNVGVQVRKLFQPKLYPDAAIHKVFNEFFGGPTLRDTKTICAVGFEPNPNHEQRLKGIKANLNKEVFFIVY